MQKKTKKKESNVLQRVGNFLGDVTNKALGIQTAEASQIGGPFLVEQKPLQQVIQVSQLMLKAVEQVKKEVQLHLQQLQEKRNPKTDSC